MIKTYKILNKSYDERVAPGLMQSSVITTGGRDFKLYKKVMKYDLRKYSFTGRIVDLWSCLPICVVKSPSVYSFKKNLVQPKRL